MSNKTYQPFDDLLKSSGVRFNHIASEIGVNNSTFYKWRINPKKIDAISAAGIADVTGIELSDIIFVLKNFNQRLDKLESSAGGGNR